MKLPATILMISIALAGCGERATPKDTFAKSSEPTAVPASGQVLPESIELTFPNKLVSDYYYLNVKKMIRHRVVFQYSEGTPAEIDASIKQSMLAAGFAFHDVRTSEEGGTHSRYAKKGYGMAHVLLKPTAAPGTDEYIIKGEIAFDLPPPQFNPPSPAKKAAPPPTGNTSQGD